MNPVLLNMHVIGSLRMGDKLCTCKTDFVCHPPSLFRSVTRVYYGEGRLKNMNDVANCVQNAIRMYKDQNVPEHAGIIKDALQRSVEGLTNLRETYVDDSRAAAQLDMILVLIKNALDM